MGRGEGEEKKREESEPVGGGGREMEGSWVGYGHRGWVEREV